MSTHDYVIDNQSAVAFRADLNNALAAIVTQNSNATAPTATFANMIWYDTATNILKKRNEANSAWINLGTVDEAGGTFTPTGGTATIATQAEAEAGTDNTKMMTPLRTAQAIAALSGLQNISIQTSGTSFTVPAGVTELYVLAAGGGAGGNQNTTTRGGGTTPGANGGRGGFVASKHTVTPGSTITYAVGAGGAGSNTGSGAAGGTTTVSTLSLTATGGAVGGVTGTGSGGNLVNATVEFANGVLSFMPLGGPLVDNALAIYRQVTPRPGGASLTAAIAYTAGGTNLFGAGGSGETATNTASGGVGGAVIFIY